VHPDDHQLVGVLLFEAHQVGNDVNAVDAAVRPEIEQHHLAPQLGKRERPVDVDPVETVGEFGGGARPRAGTAADDAFGGAHNVLGAAGAALAAARGNEQDKGGESKDSSHGGYNHHHSENVP